MASTWANRPRNAAAAARARKYASREHREAKARFRALVEAGVGRCWRCSGQLYPGQWHVGHDDRDPTVIRGPEHVRCNLRAAAAKGARIVNARRRAAQEQGWTSLRW